jgi:hypothetical protein
VSSVAVALRSSTAEKNRGPRQLERHYREFMVDDGHSAIPVERGIPVAADSVDDLIVGPAFAAKRADWIGSDIGNVLPSVTLPVGVPIAEKIWPPGRLLNSIDWGDFSALNLPSEDFFWVEDEASTTGEGIFIDEDRFSEIDKRLAALAVAAEEEEITPSKASQKDLLRFLTTHREARRPAIYLLETGNYRAVWKSSEGEQIGLQFRGNEEIQYVIFAKREYPTMFSRSSGRDSFRGIEKQIDANGIRWLMTA